MTDPPKTIDSAALALPSTTTLVMPDAATRRIELKSGRWIELVEDEQADWIAVRSPAGQPVVLMRVTDEGPDFSFSQASLEVAALQRLDVVCETLRIKVDGSASIDVGGDLTERIGGSMKRESSGSSTVTASTLTFDAFPGGVEVKAHQDVSIVGERVRLNSEDPPMPLTWDEFNVRRSRELAKGELARDALDEDVEPS